ncbi:MAG: bifunctional DNA primase/polymerase [Cyanobacteriota bacterium]|nr:bifunctional DNA primase/polymerase [Cyanobacteriota bacterium]
MVVTRFYPLQESLIEGLNLIPQSWALTPLLGNKAPYRTGWQHEKPLSQSKIIAEIEEGTAKGYGIRTGSISGGLVAIDFDGSSALQKALELSVGELLPDTVTFTSNSQGHQIFVIPNRIKGGIRAVDVQQCQHIFAEAGDEVIADYLTLDEALEVAKGGVR